MLFHMNTVLKTLIFFSFIFLNGILNAQNPKDGRTEADEDWANGAAKYHDLGGGKGGRLQFDSESHLYFEHLGLDLHIPGCLRMGTEQDYNNRIKEKLKEKYGRDMFATFEHDKRAFYDSLNRLKTRKAIFSDGDKRFFEWFYQTAQYIQDDKKNANLGDNVKITLIFTINRKGKCKQFSLSKTEIPEFNAKLLSLFQGFFKHCHWLPAKENGVRVDEAQTYDIVLNPN
jgi:hypothetical protein